MTTVDYSQRAEDHQSFLVLVRHTGKQLSWKHFCRCWERISALDCVAIPGQKRDMWIRYKKSYSRENNEWGDFQGHRKILGLVSVGRCSTEAEFEELFASYKKEKEQYSESLFNSRLVVYGMNTDGTALTKEQQEAMEQKSVSPEPMSMKIDSVQNVEETDSNICDTTAQVDENSSSAVKDTNGDVTTSEEEHTDPLRKSSPIKFVKISKPDPKPSKQKSESGLEKTVVQKTLSNSKSKDMTGSEVVFYPSVEDCDSLEESLREFVTSLFFVLEGKRLDRSFERADRQTLLCAPIEKKDYVGIDPESKSYKKKCQGRLRKHLADLCLQASLPGEAMLHYTTAIDILRPVNDHLWMAACYEGLCSASVISNYTKLQPVSTNSSLRRNQSFSVKRGVAGMDKQRTGSVNRSYANGLQDLPEIVSKSCLNPDDIVEKYREALGYYSKYKNAGLIELEANLKACRVLIEQQKHLLASEFLQNVVKINLQFTDEDRICRYITLSSLYGELGFMRKAAFFKRVAAMQCVAPQNPKHDWHSCHQLLVQALNGYRIYLDPKDGALKGGDTNGWPVVQVRVLHEIIYSAKRMGNLPLAIRYTTLLLHTLLNHLSDQEKRDVVSSLENLTSQCEGTVHPLALDSGLILPPIHLYNIPLVKSFKLMPLHPHLEPQKLTKTDSSASNNVFIYTPITIGSSDATEEAKTDVDFCWVEGDMSEVQMQVFNPMPDELKVSSMSLLTEGAEIEPFPTSLSVPPASGPYMVKVMHRPTSTGDLKIMGYTSNVFGVRSNCRLRDCTNIPQTHFLVKVVPALPTIQLTTSLRKSASFLSFGEEFNVVTSGTAVLYTGQSSECAITIQNSSKLPVELIKVCLETTKDTKDYVQEVFQWSTENIHSQLPIQPNNILCFTVALHGVSDFMPALEQRNISSPVKERNISVEGKSVEAILKVEYSGGPGFTADYCRCCSVAFTIDVMPSLVFQKWDVMPSESCEHCYLLFDVQNMSGVELDVQYSSQCVHLQPQQIRRICLQIERCPPPVDEPGQSQASIFSQFLSTFVDIRWSIPSQKIHGKASIEHLTWTSEQQELVHTSPVSWEVKLNGQILSPLYIGSLEYMVGQQIRLDVEVSLKSETDVMAGRTGVLTFCCCQYCDNGEVRYDVSGYVSPLGAQSVVIAQISPDEPVLHSCTYMFLCCGFYRFEVMLKVKGQGHTDSPEVMAEGYDGLEEQTYKCSSVIEVNIEE